MAADFEDLYTRQLTPVWRYVRARIPTDDDAEDVTGEIFERAWRGWERYDERRGPPAAWLFGIAHHVVADWWRRRERERPAPSDPAASSLPAADGSQPEHLVLAAEARRELRGHLGLLTGKERDAVALRFGAGLRAREVGAALGVSEVAARMLVYRAVSKLREAFTGD